MSIRRRLLVTYGLLQNEYDLEEDNLIMIKRKVKYYNFDGKLVEKELSFHLNKLEIFRILGKEGDLEERLAELSKKSDLTGLINLITSILSSAYGEISEDGETFVKTPELRAKFEASEVFAELFGNLFDEINGPHPETAQQFMAGIAPKAVPTLAKVTRTTRKK